MINFYLAYLVVCTYLLCFLHAQDLEEYRVRTKPQIVQWLADVDRLGGCAECVVVFCITAEVRAAKKSKVKGLIDVEEKLRNDFKGKV